MSNKLLGNFSGGMNISTNPLIIKDTEAELIINYSLDTVGSLTRRNGYDVFASQPVAARRILGLYQYTNTGTSAETTQVMAADNATPNATVIYYNNASTWTSSKANDTYAATITNFNRYRFATFLDYILRVNGRDVTGSSNNVNGGVWATTNCPTVIIPSFISVFKDRVYVAPKGSKFYYSSLPNDPGTDITWDTTNNWVMVNPDDGDEFTAFENNGSHLLIFKNRALYRWNWGDVEPDKIIGVGTESQESVKTNFDFGLTFFANSKGIYIYDKVGVKNISRKIEPLIRAVPTAYWGSVASEIDNDHYFCYLGDSITYNGNVYSNVMAVYSISLNSWVIYSLGTPWRVGNKLILSGSESIYFGSSNGRTYLWDSGASDDSGGAAGATATDISTDFISKEFLITYPGETQFDYINFISEYGLTNSTFYRINRAMDFNPLCGLQKRFTQSQHLGDVGNSIQIRITDSSQMISRIDGFNIEYTTQGNQQ